NALDPLNEQALLKNVNLKELTTTPARKSQSGEGYCLLQFRGAVLDEWKKTLQDVGVTFYDYIPEYCFLVKLRSDQKLSLMRTYPFIRWIGDYLPYYKFSEKALRDYKFAKPVDGKVAGKKFVSDNITVTMKSTKPPEPKEYEIIVYPDCELSQVKSQLKNLGAELLLTSESQWKTKIRIRISPERLADVSYIPEVKFIEPAPEFELRNNKAADPGVCDTRSVWEDLGIYGQGQVVCVCDTGIDQGSAEPLKLHDDFEDGAGNSRVLEIFDLSGDGATDYHGHGTHVAGSVLGNGVMSAARPVEHFFPETSLPGMAPEASLIFQAVADNAGSLVGIPDNLNILFQQAYDAGADLHTNSWGLVGIFGTYTSLDQDVDEFTWAHPEMTILFAAGNDGVDADQDGVIDLGSIGSPACAKNCISVGASENNRKEKDDFWGGWGIMSTDRIADNVNGLAAFSSRGPTLDGRYKPDVVAPGTYVLSTKSSLAPLDNFWAPANLYYAYMGGTSMATPLTCGMVALLREFLVSEGISTPPSSLLKALLINGCAQMYPGQYGYGEYQEIPTMEPNNVDGWGRVNPANSIYGHTALLLDAHREIVNRGENSYDIYVLGSVEPLSVTLVWNDYPGSLEANGALVNNLDLEVEDPDGNIIYPLNPVQPSAAQSFSPASRYDAGLRPSHIGDGIAIKLSPCWYPLELNFMKFAIIAPESGTYYMDINIYDEGKDGLPHSLIAKKKKIAVSCDIYSDVWNGYIGYARIPLHGIVITSGEFFAEIRWEYSAEFSLVSGYEAQDAENAYLYSSALSGWLPLSTESPLTPGIEILGKSVKQEGLKDSVNNVEGIRISSPAFGKYVVRVTGTNIAQPPQRYSLVITGNISDTEPQFTPTPTPTPSPTPTPILPRFRFETGTDDWVYVGNIAGFDSPLSSWTYAHLGLSPQGSLHSFGYWHSPDINIESAKMYQATFTVSSTQNTADLVPAFRLRVNQRDNWLGWMTTINSKMGVSPTQFAPCDYTVFITPRSDDKFVDIQLAFDSLSFDINDDPSAWLYLEQVILDEVPSISAVPDGLPHYTFASGAEGWQYKGKIELFDEPNTSVSDGRLGLSPDGSTNCFSYWYSPGISVEGGKLYRARCTVSSSQTDPDLVPGFRLRAYQQETSQVSITSVDSNQRVAPTFSNPVDYDVYIRPQPTGLSETLELSFDITSFNPKDDATAWVYLEEVILEEISIP
ncbi:S8 family serine peptidase, partial [Candidatus Sumerlaeota bacterium]|nr:S8 family serine peptidase [Candidatus Sumerlaeota bacterium]